MVVQEVPRIRPLFRDEYDKLAALGAFDDERLRESRCAGVCHVMPLPNATFVGKIDPAVVSPRSYNTCYKGYVVDIADLEEAYSGPGNVSDANIGVQYADTPIADRTSCEGTELAAFFYYYSVSGDSVGAGVRGSVSSRSRSRSRRAGS